MSSYKTDNQAYVIARQLNMLPALTPVNKDFYEEWGETAPLKTLRFAQVKSGSNICIQFDPELLPTPE